MEKKDKFLSYKFDGEHSHHFSMSVLEEFIADMGAYGYITDDEMEGLVQHCLNLRRKHKLIYGIYAI